MGRHMPPVGSCADFIIDLLNCTVMLWWDSVLMVSISLSQWLYRQLKRIYISCRIVSDPFARCSKADWLRYGW